MTRHDYSTRQALDLILKKIGAANAELASQVRAAIDAGKDVDEETPVSSQRKRRRYRKTVPLSEQEALRAAVDVLQAYFVEQPLFVLSATESIRAAALSPPRREVQLQLGSDVSGAFDTARDTDKALEVELRTETQLIRDGDATYQLSPARQADVDAQRANLAHLRELLKID